MAIVQPTRSDDGLHPVQVFTNQVIALVNANLVENDTYVFNHKVMAEGYLQLSIAMLRQYGFSKAGFHKFVDDAWDDPAFEVEPK